MVRHWFLVPVIGVRIPAPQWARVVELVYTVDLKSTGQKALQVRVLPRAWAGVAELAYAADSKSAARKGLGVRIPSPAYSS